MMHRRSFNIAAVLTTLVAPLTAFAQIRTGSVTTDPAHQAPALGMPLLIVFALVIAAFAVYRLRRPSAGPIVGFVLLAAVALAGFGYAGVGGVTISGAECTRQTISPFAVFGLNELMSECPNLIQIVDIELSCGTGPGASNPAPATPAPDCSVGQILSKGDTCTLPTCVR